MGAPAIIIASAHHGDVLATIRETKTFDDDTAEMNPDGIHWGFSCHRGIADVVAPVVDAVRRRANRDAGGPTPTPVEARRVNPLT